MRESSALVARASTGVSLSGAVSWEIALQLAATAIRLVAGRPLDQAEASPEAVARVTDSVRTIERDPGASWTLSHLAPDAGQSPFRYLRTFQHLTGVTPHQFILRTRLRQAATGLVADDAKVIEVALESGFGDISNFNRSFRAEFGVAPQTYRQRIWSETRLRPRSSRASALPRTRVST
jgi:AraC-like DNA-binding protein